MTTVLSTPATIDFWIYRSRMSQLSIELLTGMRHSRGPILASMYAEGLIDAPLRGTKINKQRVLRAMCDQMTESMAAASVVWEMPDTIRRALEV